MNAWGLPKVLEERLKENMAMIGKNMLRLKQ